MNIQLSDHFTYKRLLRFTLPSIIMMIFTSIYGVVDGFFVSNYAGKTQFTAINFIMPVVMILGSIGYMVGTGGSAIIGKTLGEGKIEKANKLFSMFIYITIIVGIICAAIGFLVLRPIASALGAEDEMLDLRVQYGRVVLLALPAYMLQYEFQSFFVTAEKPQLGLYVTVAAGVTNIVLDWLLVGVLSFGLQGAAAATAISQCVGGFFPLFYFARPNDSLFRLGRTEFDGKSLGRACTNGCSELMSNISMSVVNMLYNVQLLKYAGNDGVAAYGVLMYVNMIFLAAFIGYTVGTAPVISFNYGARNTDELKSLLRKSLIIIGVFAICMFAAAELLSKPLAKIYVGYDDDLFSMTVHAFLVYYFSFLFAGYAIFGSSFFTALNNGLVSALISFLRTLVFQVGAVLIFPLIWGLDGIWFSTVAAEVAAVALTVVFMIALRKKYNY